MLEARVMENHNPTVMTLDDLRRVVAKADALSHAAEAQLDNLVEPDRRSLERCAHLAGAAAEATAAALAALDLFATQGRL
jgi:hypothetical protein